MFGVSFQTAKLILILVTGLAWGIPFFLTFYIIADVPAPMVQSVWKRALNSNKKKFLDLGELFGNSNEKSLEKRESNKDKYRIFCSRLGMRTNYEDLESKGNSNMIIMVTVGLIFLLIGMTMTMSVLVAVGAIMLPVGMYLKYQPFMAIDSKIKKLDKAIIFEAPIFINNIRVMNTKTTLEKVLESYLDHAGAMEQDIKLTLASLKNNTNVRALIDMSNRMQRGQRLEEISSMVDLMKALYSGTNVERCCMNLELLANQINDLHVKPFIDARKDKKLMIMQFAVALAVVLIFIMYSSPMIIEMALISKDLNT